MKRTCTTKKCYFAFNSLFIFAILLIFNIEVYGKNYFFSSSSGDDTRSTTQAQNPSTPWKTINKLNSIFSSVIPGDSLLLCRGDTFYGSILVAKSGTSALPIVIGAYGIGANPIIDAFQTLTGWTNLGGNIWESSTTSCSATLNLVLLDGKIQRIGRFPNYPSFLRFEAFSGSTSITDNQLVNTPNWTGAEVVIRVNTFNMVRNPITNHTNTVITYSNGATSELRINNGYFFQNDPKTLDLNGEWYLNPTTFKIRMYFADNNPTGHIIRASNNDYGVTITNKSYITITNIQVQGANVTSFLASGSSSYIKIFDCVSLFSGQNGIRMTDSGGYFDLERNYIDNSLAEGIVAGGTMGNGIIRNNTVNHTGLIEGMSYRYIGGCNGIETVVGDNHLVEYNKVDSSGKHGIFLRGNGSIARYNYIKYSCLTLDDAGGIYTAGIAYPQKQITNNVILNTIGNYAMTSNTGPCSPGIYLDQPQTGTYVEGNTVAYSGAYGIQLHNAYSMTMRGNIFYSNGYGIRMINSGTSSTTYFKNVRLVSNLYVSTNSAQLDYLNYSYNAGTTPLTFGTADSNYYCGTVSSAAQLRTIVPGKTTNYTVTTWKALGFDTNGGTKPAIAANSELFEYNATKSNKTVSLANAMIDVYGNKYASSVTLAPYTSVILFPDPNPTIINHAPVFNNQSFSVAENSANGITAGTVAASDADAGQTKTFSIVSGNANGAFAINASTGILTVANSAALNFEGTPPFALVIKVQDNGTPVMGSQATITISLTDVNEIPVIANQSFSIAENSANGTTVGMVLATDPDIAQTRTFSIVSGNANGAFAINASTGVLTVANSAALDFSTNKLFLLTIKVSDNGTGNLFATSIITVNVSQEPNQPPVIIDQTFTLNQNVSTGTLVGIVNATDPDPGQSLDYSIVSGNASGTFSINSSTGEIFVLNPSSFSPKSSSSFALTVKVQDNASASLSNQAIITLQMIHSNQPPVILKQTISTLEHQPKGTLVGNISANDPDSGSPVTFSISSGNIGGGFAINANSGIITINNPDVVCYEGHPIVNLNVTVQDNEGLTSDALITIDVADINEMPVCTNQIFTLNENSPNETKVGSVSAVENDFNQTLTYSIVSGNANNAFSINTSDGSIKINNTSALNFEETKEFSLIISVQDNGSGNLTAFCTNTIKLLDVNDPPVMENKILSVIEKSAPGTEIGYLVASDPDISQALKYTIVGGNENQAFNLNSSTGLLSVADSSELSFGRNPLTSLTVKVQDNGVDSLSTLSIVTINLQPAMKELTDVPFVFSDNDISVYPNPTKDIVNVDLGKITNKSASIRIFGMGGQEIHSSVTQNQDKVIINLENKQPGAYIAKITTDDGVVYSRKIIVQK